MRNVRALCSLAIVAAAFGCGGSKEEAKAPTEPVAQEPAPPTAVEGQMPPSAGAEPGATEQPAPGAPAPGQPPAGAQQVQLSSNDMLVGTISCMLGPVMHGSQMGSPGMHGQSQRGQAPGGGSMGGGPSGQATGGGSSAPDMQMGTGPGPMSDRCATTAKAANVSPVALYNYDPAAIDTVRKAIDGRLSAEGASSDAANNVLAFYDKGVAAAKEARVSQNTIALAESAMGASPPGRTRSGSSGSAQKPPAGGRSTQQMTVAPDTADQIRAHAALSDLYQYGRNLGATEGGTQAQALAWVIGANRFMAVDHVPAPMKSLVAEPMFSALLNVPAPAPTAGRMAPAWNEYLAAAARSVSATSATPGKPGQAVGGGPGATNEKANLEQVVKTTEDKLQVLGQQLPFTSMLRSEVDRTTANLRAFEASAATAPEPKGTTQPKKPAPSQQPKKQQPAK